MLKKTMTYVDFDGVERTETFYFNLTKAELAEMELSTKGGLAEKINAIVAAENGEEIIRLFKDVIARSYGEKSEDGKRFVKSEELSKAFTQTQAYSDLFMELSTSAEAASAFINGVVPVMENPPPKS